jgi:single-stranded DNA-specific DHH superfamily exonuclease
MTHYDIFNGDADGICALQQLRLNEPKDAVRITGLKRDIDLLKRVEVEFGDEIVVLDVSFDKNREAVDKALKAGAHIFYSDHHFSGDLIKHKNLDLYIDLAPNTCTSLIINKYLNGAQAHWAVVGAFGDNFDVVAADLGGALGLNNAELEEYQQLGVCLNYNGYGFELEDLFIHPANLFEAVSPYGNPLDFIRHDACYSELLKQYQVDLALSNGMKPEEEDAKVAIFMLPNESWAKRIVGVMGNDLAKEYPDRAHALLVDMGDENYRVSVRAPYNNKSGADDLCRKFEGGGGRKAAAGVNRLPMKNLEMFYREMKQSF